LQKATLLLTLVRKVSYPVTSLIGLYDVPIPKNLSE
jgi:hypothetical protein